MVFVYQGNKFSADLSGWLLMEGDVLAVGVNHSASVAAGFRSRAHVQSGGLQGLSGYAMAWRHVEGKTRQVWLEYTQTPGAQARLVFISFPVSGTTLRYSQPQSFCVGFLFHFMAGHLLRGLVAPDSLADMVEEEGPWSSTSVSPTLSLFLGFLSLRPISEGELKGTINSSVAWAMPGSIRTVHRGSGTPYHREERKGEHYTERQGSKVLIAHEMPLTSQKNEIVTNLEIDIWFLLLVLDPKLLKPL